MRISFLVYTTCLLITILMIGGCYIPAEYAEGRDTNQIIDWLGEPEVYKHEMAKEALRSFGPSAERFLIRRLNDKNESIREGVIDILRSEHQPYVVENLDRLIFDPDPLIRRGALASLCPLALGLEDVAFPLIKEALTDSDKTVRFEAAFIFAERKKPFKGVIENLILAANSRKDDYQHQALVGFVSLDTYPIEAVPGYILALDDFGDKGGWRIAASHGLKLAGYDTVFGLISWLSSPDKAERDALISMAAEYGFTDPKACELLIPPN